MRYFLNKKPPVCLHALGQRLVDRMHADGREMALALEAWGSWCHSPDGMGGAIFETAVEATPAEFFPGGVAVTPQEHERNKRLADEELTIMRQDFREELGDVVYELLEMLTPTQMSHYVRGHSLDKEVHDD